MPRAKRKMAKRKKSPRTQLVVLDGDGARAEKRLAVSPGERRLSFGERWSYAPAPEASDYIKLRPRYQLFIGGKFVAPRSGKYFDSINPATEEKLAEIAEASEKDVAAAVSAARRAYDNVWSKMPGRERVKYLYPISRLIQAKSRKMAV